jgi:hypothetical protein
MGWNVMIAEQSVRLQRRQSFLRSRNETKTGYGLSRRGPGIERRLMEFNGGGVFIITGENALDTKGSDTFK